MLDIELTPELLLPLVSDQFGQPSDVIFTGSLACNLGNRGSDIDISAIVDAEVAPLPMPTFLGKHRVDIRFYQSAEVDDWELAASDSFIDLPARYPTIGEFYASRFALKNFSRVAQGCVLSGNAEKWSRLAIVADKAVCGFWAGEERKYSFHAAVVTSPGSTQRQQALCMQIRCMLEAYAAYEGYPYFGQKWLPMKLQLMGRSDLRAMLITALAPDANEHNLTSVVRQISDAVGPEPYEKMINSSIGYVLGEGVAKAQLLDALRLVRWNARMIQLSREADDFIGTKAPFLDAPRSLREELYNLARGGWIQPVLKAATSEMSAPECL